MCLLIETECMRRQLIISDLNFKSAHCFFAFTVYIIIVTSDYLSFSNKTTVEAYKKVK